MSDYDPRPGPRCLVTGATGYIGGRLVPELLEAGLRVRCLARSPAKLRDYPWAGDAEVVRGDVTDAGSVAEALRGIDVAYYLVHALGTGHDFEETDRKAARIFGEQARAAGVGRIVYLGGLTPAGVPEERLSPHLRSRAEVGRILLESGVPTTVLRAAVIIGSGSASFEMLRYLAERLPVMVTPRWVRTRIQPIGVRDVLRTLVGSARMPAEVNRAFDIGGPEVLTYLEMMQRYAAVAGLPRRLILPVPVLTPDSPATGSAWSPRCPRPSRARSPNRCATRSSATNTTSSGTSPIPRGVRSASTTRCRWPCNGCGTPRSPPGGRRPPCPARPVIPSPPTPTGRAAASTPINANRWWTRRPGRCGG